MQLTNSQLKKYLLGDLDEQAIEEIGVQIISETSTEDKLLIAENDLIEDFLEGNLSRGEEKLFYENFLICEDRQQQVREINLFKQFAKKEFQTESPVEKTDDSAENFWEKLKKLFGVNLRFAAPVLAVLIIAAFGIYFFYPSNNLSPLEQEYAELNRKDFGNTNEFAEFSNVDLISGTYRDTGAGNKLKAENLSDKIFFRLDFPVNVAESELLNAEIVRDQKTIFRQPGIRVYKNQDGQEIRLLLPKTVLSKGRYQIKIENPKTEESPFIYDFAVE